MSTDLPLPSPELSLPPSPAAPTTPPGPSVFARLGCFLYNHNPFYLISACLTLIGIHSVFGVEEVGQLKTASVLLAIGGYTGLLGLTGVLIVRFGKVWEDARTVLLAVILMLLATSVCTDELLMLEPAAALRLIVGALFFAVVWCEAIIRGLRIRFGAEFRVPLFLLLSILFLYPYVCASEVRDLTILQAQWRVLGFPVIFALGLLSLWPAVLRGSRAVADNGTPWNWPLYPWCLFIVIAAAGAFRTRILTESFDPSKGMEVTFGTFYLVPILFAVVWLVLETGRVEARKGLVHFALLSGLALVWLALPGRHGILHHQFYNAVTRSMGSPVFWCLILLLVMYGVARLRGMLEAGPYMWLALGGLAFVGPATTGVESIRFLPWPLVVIGLAQMWNGWGAKSAARFTGGAICCLSAVPTILRWTPGEHLVPQLTYQIALLSAAGIGFRFREGLGRSLERGVCLHIPLLAAIAVLRPHWFGLIPSGGLAYTVVLTTVSLLIGWRFQARPYLWAGGAIVAGGLGEAAALAYRSLVVAVGRRAMWALSWSVASFLVAVLISVAKGGHLNQMRTWTRYIDRVRNACGPGNPPPHSSSE